MENGLSWLSLGNGNVVTPRNTIISSDYNDLTNKPIITLNGTNQNPIKLWTLEMGVYILNGYIQHSNELMSEGKGLFVTIAAMMVNGKYVVSAYIPFWEGLYEYILPSSSSETYTQHQIINMVSQENTLTLDNEKIYTPMENYHPSTKKYADDMFTILRNELSNIGINRDNIEDLKQVNRRRDIIIQALLSQNSDKTVTIEEEKHNISLDLAIDKGMTTINELEGSTLVNVSKQKESIPLSCKADTVENTNVANLTENGVIRPIIQGNTLVNNNIQWDDKVVIGNQIEQMSGVEVNIEDCNGEIDVALEGHTGVNLSNRKGGLLSTTFDSQSGNYITLNPSEDCGTTLGIEGNTMVNYCNNGNISMGLNKEINVVDDTGKMITLDDTADSGLVDVKVEGRTLVNLADIQNKFVEQVNTYYKDHTLCNTSRLKLNNPYTFIIDCKYLEGHNSNYNYFEFGVGEIVNGYNSSVTTNLNMNRVTMPNSGVYVLCVEFKDFRGYEYLACRPCRRASSPVEGEKANYDISVLLLEGDHTDKELSYFEGLKSVGQGADGISVASMGKNLFNKDDIVFNKAINSSSGEESISANYHITNFIPIKPNTRYIRSLGSGIYYYDKDYKYISFLDQSVKSPSNAKYCKLQVVNTWDLNVFQFEEGTQLSKYQPHKSNKKEILYYNPTKQTWEKPILREWDSIEKHSDGKYYYHKRSEEVVFNGSENWLLGAMSNSVLIELWGDNVLDKVYGGKPGEFICDILPKFNGNFDSEYINLYNSPDANKAVGIKLSTQKATDLQTGKQWLQANNVTLVYKLAQEEVYECANLSLDTYSNQTNIFNNSLIPCNMEIKNSVYDCILFPNTKYTVKLGSNISNDIQVNLGGTNTVVNTNIFEITTPNELTNESLTLYGNGEVINNVMLFIDDMDNVDTDGYFEGMKSSFEDQIIPQNMFETTFGYGLTTIWSYGQFKDYNFVDGKTYTIMVEHPKLLCVAIYNNKGANALINTTYPKGGKFLGKFTYKDSYGDNKLYINYTEDASEELIAELKMVILEGDYTSNPPTYEEVVNHSGKYRVEYKVVGKNKFDGRFIDGMISSTTGILNGNYDTYKSTKDYISVKPNTIYSISNSVVDGVFAYDKNYNYLGYYFKDNISIFRNFTTFEDCKYIKLRYQPPRTESELFQIEEGSTPTPYEPYKESIKTLYLNSPLLEGDKIVTYKGNVCHYHKMGKVVLDGSEPGAWMPTASNHNGISFCYNSSALSNASNSTEVGLGYGKLFCDKLKYIIQDGTKTINQHSLTGYNQIARNSGRQYSDYIYISTTCSDARSFRQWLAENPVTVIYELTNPYYEIIESNTDTSIELFSNVSHLSVDTSVPINFVEFKQYTDELTYLENNTQYRVTFNCNVEGKPISISLGGTEIEDITKLENSVLITTPNELVDEKLIIDGKGIVNIDNVRVTKGDMMYNKYFEGMKSSFEMEDTVKTIIKYCPIEFGKGGRIE